MSALATVHAASALPLAAGAQFIDPKVLARVANLELVARTVVEGFLSGLHRSSHLGSSMDFAEHRAYMPGDDVRRIDWRLYARTDRYYLKEFEADTNTDVTVVLDVSASMSYGSAGLTKLEYAKYLAACLAYVATRQRDRVGLVTFDDDVVDVVPPSAKHLPAVLQTLDRARAGGQGALDRPLLKLAERVRRRSIVALLSDLYEEPARVLRAVAHLRAAGNDVVVFHLLDPAELEFPFDDAASFRDLESDERVPVVPDQLRDQYRALVAAHVAELARLLGESGIDYAMFDTSRPLDFALFEYLSRRQQLSRVR